MKKLFTLVALLTMFMGVRAAETVVDYEIDYSKYQGFPFYVMGYVPEFIDGVMTDFGANYGYKTDDEMADGDFKEVGTVATQGGTVYHKVELAEPAWHQYFIADGIKTEIDGSYTVTAMVKASEAVSINVNMGWGWGDGQQTGTTVAIGTDWAEVEWEYSGIGGSSCNLVAQPGGSTATIEWKWVKVTHVQKDQKPIEWIENLVNGDAEKSWADLGLADVRYDDQANNFKVCAWSKEREVNMNDNGGWDPFPAPIEEVDGSHVFVCHGKAATTEGDASAWDNQFWIESPQEWKAGTQLKIHFRYKASADVSSTDTQIHHQNPSDYLIWHAIGNIHFTTEWQEFDDIMTIADDMAGGWSIAFNLNSVVKDAVTFYFDDLSWKNMKLEEGYFVAGANTKEGLDYDFDNAVEFAEDAEAGCLTAVIGAKNEYVNQVMISTVRGNDAAFKSSTLKPSGQIINDPDNWMDYQAQSLAKLNLPGSGIWKIYLDIDYNAMAFEMLEGTADGPIEIKPNPTEITIYAPERDDIKDDDHPEGTGQPWDSQFWIKANRTLSTGETTVVAFKYKATKAAKSSTQCHADPGSYLHWAAIGDVNFTEDWQEFETTFTVAAEANNMQSIAFNLAEIKDANEYHLKDFVWKLEDNTESLINQTGSTNFFKKEGADTEITQGIKNVTTNNNTSAAIYNLAGQRVSKDYKGIVVKSGKKYVVK